MAWHEELLSFALPPSIRSSATIADIALSKHDLLTLQPTIAAQFYLALSFLFPLPLLLFRTVVLKFTVPPVVLKP